MRLKLFRRRLGISAPRMSVRSHLPWPLRWAVTAIALGAAGALALWTFEFGKGITGLDSGAKQELDALRTEVKALKDEREKLISTANTAESLLKTERAAQTTLATQVQTLEAESAKLKDDVRFFERLIPSNAAQQELAIRALQVEQFAARVNPAASASSGTAVSEASPGLRYRMLVIQTGKNPVEFSGRFEFLVTGTQNGKPWTLTAPDARQQNAPNFRLAFKSYQRVEGEIVLPPNTVVKSIQAQVIDRNGTRASQISKL